MSINATRVRALKRAGKKAPEIAKALKLSESHVYGILRRLNKGRTATGVDKGVARLARKTGISMPKTLNGFSKHWLEA